MCSNNYLRTTPELRKQFILAQGFTNMDVGAVIFLSLIHTFLSCAVSAVYACAVKTERRTNDARTPQAAKNEKDFLRTLRLTFTLKKDNARVQQERCLPYCNLASLLLHVHTVRNNGAAQAGVNQASVESMTSSK